MLRLNITGSLVLCERTILHNQSINQRIQKWHKKNLKTERMISRSCSRKWVAQPPKSGHRNPVRSGNVQHDKLHCTSFSIKLIASAQKKNQRQRKKSTERKERIMKLNYNKMIMIRHKVLLPPSCVCLDWYAHSRMHTSIATHTETIHRVNIDENMKLIQRTNQEINDMNKYKNIQRI